MLISLNLYGGLSVQSILIGEDDPERQS